MKKYTGEMILRFYWSDVIPFTIENSGTDCAWEIPHPSHLKDRGIADNIWRHQVKKMAYCLARLRRRKITLFNLLLCVDCRGERLKQERTVDLRGMRSRVQGPEWDSHHDANRMVMGLERFGLAKRDANL